MSAEQQYPPQPLPPGYEVATIARRLGSRVTIHGPHGACLRFMEVRS